MRVSLGDIAYARSGDKGNISNIGVIAREPEFLSIILRQLTPASVKAYFGHLVAGDVVRYLVPGLHACNFVMHDALDGGGALKEWAYQDERSVQREKRRTL